MSVHTVSYRDTSGATNVLYRSTDPEQAESTYLELTYALTANEDAYLERDGECIRATSCDRKGRITESVAS